MMSWTPTDRRGALEPSSFHTSADTAFDREVVAGIASGDADALARLYDRHSGAVYSLALRVLGDTQEAEEVSQDVFAHVWSHVDRYDAAHGPVSAWLLAMTRSRAIDRLRMRRGEPPLAIGGWRSLTGLEAPASGLAIGMLTADQKTLLRTALDRLPLAQRTTIELAFFGGLTHVEIAAHLEEPLGAVRTRIRRGLLRLRDAVMAATP